MPYNSTIPQPTDQINNSQPQILGNFGAISTYVNVNHINFDDPAGNQGKHLRVDFPVTTNPPVVATQITLFSAEGPFSAQNELTLIKSDGTTVYATESSLTIGTDSGGWSRMPSGVIVSGSTTTAMVNPGATRTIIPANEFVLQAAPWNRVWKVMLHARIPTLGANGAYVVFGAQVDPLDWTQGFTCRVYGAACFIDIWRIGW